MSEFTRTFTPTLRQNSPTKLTTAQVDANFSGLATAANSASRSYTAASQAAMLSLAPPPQGGDHCWRSDEKKDYVFLGGDDTSISNWVRDQYSVAQIDGALASADLADTSSADKGAGLVGFSGLLNYAAGTVGKFIKDLGTSVGASMIGYSAAFTGAATRTQYAKNSEVVSLTDAAGVDPTGASDSTAGILALISSLTTGSVVEVPQGTFLFSGVRIGDFAGISNPGGVPVIAGVDGITFRGKGRGSVIKLTNEANNDLFVFRLRNGIHFENLTLDGNKANQSGAGGLKSYWDESCIILARDAKDVSIVGCKIINGKHFGLNISSDASNVNIVGNEIVDCGVAGVDIQANDFLISRNQVSGSTFGIELEGENVAVNTTTYTGINAMGAVSDNRVKTCSLAGILVKNIAYDVNIVKNHVQDCPQFGISLEASATEGYSPRLYQGKIKIHGNTVIGSNDLTYGRGISIYNVNCAVCSENTVSSNRNGIYCSASKNITIIDNMSYENLNNGMLMGGTVTAISICGNKIYNNNQSGLTGNNGAGLAISSAGSLIELKNNFLFDDQTVPTQLYGIKFNASPTNVKLHGNFIYSNSNSAILIWDGTPAVESMANHISGTNGLQATDYPEFSIGLSVKNKKLTKGSTIPATAGITWNVGDRCENSNPVVGQPKAWSCTVKGTTGTLSGVTGSITSGQTSLTCTSVANLAVGQYITIAGVTGVKTIVNIAGSVVTIDVASDATVSSAAVAYSNPTWVSEGNL